MTAQLKNLDPHLQTELKQQRLYDLAQRCWPGIVLYPLVWWTIALPRLWYVPTEQNFRWLAGIGFGSLLLSGIRILLLKRLRLRLAREKAPQEWEITAGVVLTAGFWGLTAALSLLATPIASLDVVLLAATAALCAGGIASLAISAKIVLIFLTCMLLPSIALILLGYSSQSADFAVILIAFWAGMLWVSSLPRKEYHAGLISKLKLVHQARFLDEISNTDSLTGLRNQRYFEQQLETEIRRATRSQYSLSLLLVSLDHFRDSQNLAGHWAADDSLRAVAQLLQSQLRRATDELGRYGQDEFVVLLPGVTQSDAADIAEMIRHAVEAANIPATNAAIRLTASIGGAALIPERSTSPREVMKLAVNAMHEARSQGGNQVRFAPSTTGQNRR